MMDLVGNTAVLEQRAAATARDAVARRRRTSALLLAGCAATARDAVARRRRTSALLLAGCAATALLSARPAAAQQATPAVELDPIEVQGRPQAGTAYQAATGPVNGYTATQSTAGTKTGTPLIQTPAAISVIGAEQIRDTASRSVPDALRYTPGVRSDTFDFDTSNDWFLIRGFTAQKTGYFLDGLQLFSTAFGTFRVEPWGLERLDVLRGPASTLYGGSGPGGVIDAISKRPTLVPYHKVEVGVDSHGNAYGAFDVSGPVTAGGPWFYRLAGLGRGGGTAAAARRSTSPISTAASWPRASPTGRTAPRP